MYRVVWHDTGNKDIPECVTFCATANPELQAAAYEFFSPTDRVMYGEASVTDPQPHGPSNSTLAFPPDDNL